MNLENEPKPLTRREIRRLKRTGTLFIPMTTRITNEQIFFSIKDLEFWYHDGENDLIFYAERIFVDEDQFYRSDEHE